MATADEKLCRAATSDDVAEIEWLIAAGADPNAFEGTSHMTPLQNAACHGHVTAIAALLAAGARVDGASDFGWTPLMAAACYGHTAAVDALLAAGADVHHTSNAGNTALHWAPRNGHLDVARMLLEAGAKTGVRNEDGKPPVDMVRAPARSLGAPARWCHATSPPRCHAQVCHDVNDKSNEATLRTLLTSAAPWSRRCPVAVACYAVGWEWEWEV
jgi:uncharacterized protein